MPIGRYGFCGSTSIRAAGRTWSFREDPPPQGTLTTIDCTSQTGGSTFVTDLDTRETSVALGAGEEERLSEKPTQNLAAYDAFLKGEQASDGMATFDPPAVRRALAHYDQAVALDPGFAPGTGTPEAGGLTSRELLGILRGLAGVNLVGADIVEVAPPYDHAEVTSMLALRCVMEAISALAAKEG